MRSPTARPGAAGITASERNVAETAPAASRKPYERRGSEHSSVRHSAQPRPAPRAARPCARSHAFVSARYAARFPVIPVFKTER